MEQEVNIIVDLSKRFFYIAAVVAGAFALACLAFMYYQVNNVPQNAPHEISVFGEGKAFGKPDIAQVTFGTTTQALKSQDAVNKNNEIMNNVIKAIKDLGVLDKDIQTTLYSLSPVYDYGTISEPAPMPMSAKGSTVAYPTLVRQGQIFSGYRLEQQISVKIRDFDKISDILDKATSSGATNVGSLQFAIDNPEKVQAEARAMAIAKAKEKLKDIVDQSGLKIGKLVNISEGYNNYPQPMYAQASGMAKDSGSIAPQIQTGQQEINATVTLTYQVR